METRQIGSLAVSVVGLGTNNFGMRMEADQVQPVLDAALEAGINFFDTSDSYGESEPRLAKALGRRRDDVVIATKFGSKVDGEPGSGKPEYVRTAVERSLRRLETDHIDLYQLHKPDPDTPIGETLAALDDLVRAGKVREIGASNFDAEQLREAERDASGARFVSLQNHYNLLHRDDEAEVLPECERLGIAYLPFFPLESGLLSGKYARGVDAPADSRLKAWGANPRYAELLSDGTFDRVEKLDAWADAQGRTLLELAFAWLLAKPAVASVIAGATKAEQVHANAATRDWVLTPEQVAEVDELAAP
ncbi:MAG: aldo/keto reductase [Acidimicrobiia bacterium]